MLTLSATPIPRTLNLALAGIRDLSVIETPPEDRLPIQTRVAEASAGLVRDAILRELDRGGQVFYVHNRVETIEAQAEQLRRLLPGARFVVGHGQMPEGTLEKVMIAFSEGAADVLVCTTIIESGLDIPNANTIVIDRADTLGLAQLYQLRGRVGRSSRRAYAYLLYRRRERLSDEARKRLQAIFNASELGAGFQIALSDLEIRGAGNILGGEQSGHMAAVGFDLYSRLLADAVEESKARREGRAPILEKPGAVLDLPLDAHLPDDYVPDEAQKLELYRRLARARTPDDIGAFRQEVVDRFGPPPTPVLRLVEVAELRLAAEIGRRVVDLARGGPARRPVRRGAHPRHGDAPADPARGWRASGRPQPAGDPPRRPHVRQQPGPDPAAARSGQGVAADPGRGRPAHGRRRLMRPFRFLTDASDPVPGRSLAETARRAEAIGFSVLVIPDHLVGQLAPIPAMATMAAATERLRIGTFVLNNDLRHPAVLAQDLASLDVLSDGRLEIGIGAGWNRPEYDAIGLPFDPVGTRVARLEEGVTVLKGCFARRLVQPRRPALHDHRLRRAAEADPTAPSAAVHRRRRTPPARTGRTGGGHRRARAAPHAGRPDPAPGRSTEHHVRGDGREDRLDPRRRPATGSTASSSTSTRPSSRSPSPTMPGPRPGRPSTGSGRGPASRSARTTCSRRRMPISARSTGSSRSSRCSASGSGSARS